MANFAMAIDLNKCIGCYNCQIACKDEHVGNDFPPIAAAQPTFGHFWLSIDEKEQIWSSSHIKVTYIPQPCQHCDDAPCMKAAKNGAIYKRPDGIVIIDPEKAAGQKELVEACPYGSIYWNDEKNIPQKCTFCAHLMDDNWQEPRCVQSCPTSCMYFGDLDDPASRIAKFLAANACEELHPELKTKARVSYAGLPKPHLAGTVRFADLKECANGVKVTLTGPDGKKAETATDYFGDFEFKNVPQGKCRVEYAVTGYQGLTQQIDIAGDITDLGEIALNKV